MARKERKICCLCQQPFEPLYLTPFDLLTTPLKRLIEKEVESQCAGGYVCFEDIKKTQNKLIESLFAEELGELSHLEHAVLKKFRDRSFLSSESYRVLGKELTLGQRLADKITAFAGSWFFIAMFLLVLFAWMLINATFILSNPFDPYPYILLNLILSCLAAIQAPVILMSQNRAADRDRRQAELDYKINLKSEMEVRYINSKLDLITKNLLKHQIHIEEISNKLSEKP